MDNDKLPDNAIVVVCTEHTDNNSKLSGLFLYHFYVGSDCKTTYQFETLTVCTMRLVLNMLQISGENGVNHETAQKILNDF